MRFVSIFSLMLVLIGCAAETPRPDDGACAEEPSAGPSRQPAAGGMCRDVFRVFREQRRILDDRKLREASEAVARKGVLPAFLKDLSWSEYMETLPTSARRRVLVGALGALGNRPAKVADLIAQLEPVDGVREALIEYLTTNPNIGFRPDLFFSREQAERMFSPERFRRFFPWMKDVIPVATEASNPFARNEFLYWAVLRNPTLARIPPQARAHFIDQLLISRERGQQEAGRFADLPFQDRQVPMTDVIDDFAEPGSQPQDLKRLLGVIVQSFYLQQGRFLEPDYHDGIMGSATTVPARSAAIESALKKKEIHGDNELVARELVHQMSLSANRSSLTRMRNIPDEILELLPQSMHDGFIDLREGIHNFPNLQVLLRLQEYERNFPARQAGPSAAKIQEKLHALIGLVEEVLQVSDGSKDLDQILKKYPGSAPAQELKTLLMSLDQRDRVDQLGRLADARRTVAKSALSVKNKILLDRDLSAWAIARFAPLVNDLPKNLSDRSIRTFALARLLFDHVQLDGMLTPLHAAAAKDALTSIETAPLSQARRLELTGQLLQSVLSAVHAKVLGLFGRYDHLLFLAFADPGSPPPVHMVDALLRSKNIFMMGQLGDTLGRSLLADRNISHTVGSLRGPMPIEVYNKGEGVGILRFDRNPMELTSEDIGVFTKMPTETGSMAGIVTVGFGAQLSHLQLLSKALKIPNIKIPNDLVDEMKRLDGRTVRFRVGADGGVSISPINETARPKTAGAGSAALTELPVADFTIDRPVTMEELVRHPRISGPKSAVEAKLRAQPELRENIPDGFVLPFGFFRTFLQRAGLLDKVEALATIDRGDLYAMGNQAYEIRRAIRETPLPQDMLAQVVRAMRALRARTGGDKQGGGAFFRGDTIFEDLRGFNGAGLSKTVPNVTLDSAQIEQAIKAVWMAPFSEKSLMWRARAVALETIPIAWPSVYVMETVNGASSGVILSRGGPSWQKGQGLVSANGGITSVVESNAAVEEITLETGAPVRYGISASTLKPVPDPAGGLQFVPVPAGTEVLSDAKVKALNAFAQKVESVLGDEPHGWDIEWAIDQKIRILQARPNM